MEILPAKKPDTDNISKIKDALNGVLYKDDAQVTDDHVIKFYSDRPRLLVMAKTLTVSEAKESWQRSIQLFY